MALNRPYSLPLCGLASYTYLARQREDVAPTIDRIEALGEKLFRKAAERADMGFYWLAVMPVESNKSQGSLLATTFANRFRVKESHLEDKNKAAVVRAVEIIRSNGLTPGLLIHNTFDCLDNSHREYEEMILIATWFDHAKLACITARAWLDELRQPLSQIEEVELFKEKSETLLLDMYEAASRLLDWFPVLPLVQEDFKCIQDAETEVKESVVAAALSRIEELGLFPSAHPVTIAIGIDGHSYMERESMLLAAHWPCMPFHEFTAANAA